MMTLRTLALLAVSVPTVAVANPMPELVPSVVGRACERELACLAPVYADLLAGVGEARELRAGLVIGDRLGQSDRDRLDTLAASWEQSANWNTITVEGYADASARSREERIAIGKQRAEKVRRGLIAAGVAPELVIAVGRDVPAGNRVDLTIELCRDNCRTSAAPEASMLIDF